MRPQNTVTGAASSGVPAHAARPPLRVGVPVAVAAVLVAITVIAVLVGRSESAGSAPTSARSITVTAPATPLEASLVTGAEHSRLR